MSKVGKTTGGNKISNQVEELDASNKPLTATLLQEFQNLKDNLNKFKNEDDGTDKGKQ